MQPVPGGSRPSTRPLVLIVDDAADMRRLVADVLTSAGYEVAGVPSGAAAMRFMAERTPDVMITDLFMPGMSGFSLRAAMLRRPELAGVPVIVLSAYWKRPGETLAAAEALPKPVNIDRLLAAVRRIVAAHDETVARTAATPGPTPAADAAEDDQAASVGGPR